MWGCGVRFRMLECWVLFKNSVCGLSNAESFCRHLPICLERMSVEPSNMMETTPLPLLCRCSLAYSQPYGAVSYHCIHECFCSALFCSVLCSPQSDDGKAGQCASNQTLLRYSYLSSTILTVHSCLFSLAWCALFAGV